MTTIYKIWWYELIMKWSITENMMSVISWCKVNMWNEEGYDSKCDDRKNPIYIIGEEKGCIFILPLKYHIVEKQECRNKLDNLSVIWSTFSH